MSPRLDTEEKQKDWRCVIRRQLGKLCLISRRLDTEQKQNTGGVYPAAPNRERLRVVSAGTNAERKKLEGFIPSPRTM